ncbi:MAG: hypothetical protein ABW234_03515 [Actinomycetes bacterium]
MDHAGGQVALGGGQRRARQQDLLLVAGAVRADAERPRLDLLARLQGVGDGEPVRPHPLLLQVGPHEVGGDPPPEAAVDVQGDGDRALVVVVDRPAGHLGRRDRLQLASRRRARRDRPGRPLEQHQLLLRPDRVHADQLPGAQVVVDGEAPRPALGVDVPGPPEPPQPPVDLDPQPDRPGRALTRDPAPDRRVGHGVEPP